MQYKSPKKPGDLLRKVNAKKHKALSSSSMGANLFPMKLGDRPTRTSTMPLGSAPLKSSFKMPAEPKMSLLHKRKKKKAYKGKKNKTVKVTYKPGDYKEGEEIKAIRALDEMHKGMKAKKHKKNWIAGAIKHPGALHRQLGIAQGKKIPAKTLARAASKGGTLGRRARLAQTLKSLH